MVNLFFLIISVSLMQYRPKLESIKTFRLRIKKYEKFDIISSILKVRYLNWRPPSLSELTPIIFNKGLAHLGSEASN